MTPLLVSLLFSQELNHKNKDIKTFKVINNPIH